MITVRGGSSEQFRARRALLTDSMVRFIEGQIQDLTQVTILDVTRTLAALQKGLDVASKAAKALGVSVDGLGRSITTLGSSVTDLSSEVALGFAGVSTSISGLNSTTNGLAADIVSLKINIQFNDGVISEIPLVSTTPPRLRLVPGPLAIAGTPYYMTIIPRKLTAEDKGFIFLANSDALDAGGPPVTLGGRYTHVRPDHDLRHVIVRVGTSNSARSEAYFARENIGGNKAALNIGAVKTEVLLLNGAQVSVEPVTGYLKVAV